MTILTPLTTEFTKRVNNEIRLCTETLNKELAISKDLQYADKIAKLTLHIEKLNNMLVNGWNAPKFY
jgi:hypothetical protein